MSLKGDAYRRYAWAKDRGLTVWVTWTYAGYEYNEDRIDRIDKVEDLVKFFDSNGIPDNLLVSIEELEKS